MSTFKTSQVSSDLIDFLFTHLLLTLPSPEHRSTAVPYALAISADFPKFRKKFKGKTATSDAEPYVRSSFPESWIFDDFSEYVCIPKEECYVGVQYNKSLGVITCFDIPSLYIYPSSNDLNY